MSEFTEEETRWLQALIIDWINEGFTTPPYHEIEYSLFEKLGINNDIEHHLFYDVERPHSSKPKVNKE